MDAGTSVTTAHKLTILPCFCCVWGRTHGASGVSFAPAPWYPLSALARCTFGTLCDTCRLKDLISSRVPAPNLESVEACERQPLAVKEAVAACLLEPVPVAAAAAALPHRFCRDDEWVTIRSNASGLRESLKPLRQFLAEKLMRKANSGRGGLQAAGIDIASATDAINAIFSGCSTGRIVLATVPRLTPDGRLHPASGPGSVGAFAAVYIPKGTFLGCYVGALVEAHRVSVKAGCTYNMVAPDLPVAPGEPAWRRLYTFRGVSVRGELAGMNHYAGIADRPNALGFSILLGGLLPLNLFFAVEDIPLGREVVTKYGPAYIAALIAAHPHLESVFCTKGPLASTAHCRGTRSKTAKAQAAAAAASASATAAVTLSGATTAAVDSVSPAAGASLPSAGGIVTTGSSNFAAGCAVGSCARRSHASHMALRHLWSASSADESVGSGAADVAGVSSEVIHGDDEEPSAEIEQPPPAMACGGDDEGDEETEAGDSMSGMLALAAAAAGAAAAGAAAADSDVGCKRSRAAFTLAETGLPSVGARKQPFLKRKRDVVGKPGMLTTAAGGYPIDGVREAALEAQLRLLGRDLYVIDVVEHAKLPDTPSTRKWASRFLQRHRMGKATGPRPEAFAPSNASSCGGLARAVETDSR